jgi:hypothetical protein
MLGGPWASSDDAADSCSRCCGVSKWLCCPPAGKTPEEIRRTFNIKNDFTPEEEAQVREENKWCEEL